MAWRTALGKRSRRQADYAWVVLARMVCHSAHSTAGLSRPIPARKAGRPLSRAPRSRQDRWTPDRRGGLPRQSAAASASGLYGLALWTGQRQGDLLRPPWSAYDGTHHPAASQSKTGSPRLRSRSWGPHGKAAPRLATSNCSSPLILTDHRRQAMDRDGFSLVLAQGVRRARIIGVTFNDLRGTAVTRLALAGCTEAEIATITGHVVRMSARSSTRIICIAIRRSPKAPSGSSKRERILPNRLPKWS